MTRFIQIVTVHPHSPAHVREAWRIARDCWDRENNVAAEMDALSPTIRASDPRILALQKKLEEASTATRDAVQALFDADRSIRDVGRDTLPAA